MKLTDILHVLFWILVVSGTVYCFTRSFKRLFQVTGGLMLLSVYNNLWDIGIWPIIQGLYGLVGIMVLVLLALCSNFLVLRWYKKTCKTDWLGISVVDDIVQKAIHMQHKYSLSHGIHKFLISVPTAGLWVAQKLIVGKWVPILVLALFTDGFVATAYYMKWKYKDSNYIFGKSEYIILTLTSIVSCVAWSIFTEMITLPAFKSLWETFAQ